MNFRGFMSALGVLAVAKYNSVLVKDLLIQQRRPEVVVEVELAFGELLRKRLL